MARRPPAGTTDDRARGTSAPVRVPRLVPVLGALLVVAALLAGVAALLGGRGDGGGTAQREVVRVDPAAAYRLVQEHAGHTAFQVIDVRTPEEFASGHLPGARDIDLRGADFTTQVKALPRDGTYLVYCHSGNRSAQATARMAELGFLTVYDLGGGITAWAAQGLPVAS